MEFKKPSELVSWSLENDLEDEKANATLRRYYKSFVKNFGELRRAKYDWQLDELTALVRSGQVKTVLDVGCGCGSVSIWLALQGAQVKGVDLQADRLRTAQLRADQLSVDVTFENTSLFDLVETYDAIWLEQAFHHVEPRRRAYEHLSKLMNNGGHLFISEANGWNPLLQISLFKQRGFKTIKTYIDADGREHVYGVERITTPGALTSGFKRQGIKFLSNRYFGVLPNSNLSERMSYIERLVPRFIAPAFTHYLWVGRKVGS